MTHRKRLTGLSPQEEDNFVRLAKLDSYLDSNYDRYIEHVSDYYYQMSKKFGGTPDVAALTDIVSNQLLAFDKGIYDYLTRVGFAVQDEEKYSAKVHTFASVIVQDAKVRGRI